MEMNAFSNELSQLKTFLKRRVKTARKYREKMEKRLFECLAWEQEQHFSELLQANLYQSKGKKELFVSDWEQEGKLIKLTLDPSLKPHEEVAKRFKRAKKLKLGLPFAEKLLQEAKNEETQWLSILDAFLKVVTSEELAVFKTLHALPLPQTKKSREELKIPVKPYWEYKSQSGFNIWVGKSAFMNDQLTFRYAHGNDAWLHVTDFPGSHVIIRLPAKLQLDEETLQDACQLALHFSKAKGRGEGEISFTHVKHVRRMGKTKGKVQIANEKRIFVKQNATRLASLRRL